MFVFEFVILFVFEYLNLDYVKVELGEDLVFGWIGLGGLVIEVDFNLKISNVISLKIGKVNLDYKKVGFEFCFFNYFLFKFRDVDFFVSLFIS